MTHTSSLSEKSDGISALEILSGFFDGSFLFLLREPLRKDERERATISSRNHNQAFIGEILHLTLIFII